MESFISLALPEVILNRLDAIKYTAPTPVQMQTIPAAIAGDDVLVTAQTGTGKTAAYVIPLICQILEQQDKNALILTPTREIAIQVSSFVTNMLDRKSGIKTALIIGGDPINNQLNQLRLKPRIIIGTPGRINDHLDRGSIKLDKTNYVVLDEVDRMLDMGFSIQLEEIFKYLPNKKQVLMFSATLPQNIQKMAARYLNNPKRIAIGSTIAAAETITQEVIHIKEEEKYDNLLTQLEIRTGSVIIFVKTKSSTERLAKKLKEIGHAADAIHGDLRQRNRERVMRHFRSKKNRILVATDIAARGLDISHIECVINHDLPQCEEDFIHRIGRTGRAGMQGVAVSLITPQDHVKWRNIKKMMNIDIKNDEVDEMSKTSRGGDRRRNSNRSGTKSFAQKFSSKRRDGKQSEVRFEGKERSRSRDNQRSEAKFEKREKPRSNNFSEARFERRTDKFNSKSRGDRNSVEFEGRSRNNRNSGTKFGTRDKFANKDGNRSEARFGNKDGKHSDVRFEKKDRFRSEAKKPFDNRNQGRKPKPRFAS